jgi:hypothetical protein
MPEQPAERLDPPVADRAVHRRHRGRDPHPVRLAVGGPALHAHRMTETTELRNASRSPSGSNPSSRDDGDSSSVRELVTEYRDIYGGGIWVYDRDGTLLESDYDSPRRCALERRAIGALEKPAYAAVTCAPGWLGRGRPKSLHGPDDASRASWSPASSGRRRLSRSWARCATGSGSPSGCRSRIAGLLGFGFSQLISRRITAMSSAAAAIAAGDFEQRLPTGFVPDEVHDLACPTTAWP